LNAANDNLPTSREEARAAGTKHFFTGAACARGHVDKRFVSTGQCFECQRENRRRWRALNPERERESRIRSLRAWAEREPERKKELARKWNAANSPANVARARKWKEANPERAREINLVADQNRRSRLMGAEGSHTTEDVEKILWRQKFKCAECGCNIRAAGSRHVDHIVPISKGGSNWPSNLQLLCVACNLRKSAKDPLDFARERGRLL